MCYRSTNFCFLFQKSAGDWEDMVNIDDFAVSCRDQRSQVNWIDIYVNEIYISKRNRYENENVGKRTTIISKYTSNTT